MSRFSIPNPKSTPPLFSGSRSGHIHHHDVRVADHHIFTLTGHSQEVCGLKWSPDGRYLASGGNDNQVFVWPGVQDGSGSQPVHCFSEHQGAVKVSRFNPDESVMDYEELFSAGWYWVLFFYKGVN